MTSRATSWRDYQTQADNRYCHVFAPPLLIVISSSRRRKKDVNHHERFRQGVGGEKGPQLFNDCSWKREGERKPGQVSSLSLPSLRALTIAEAIYFT